MAIYLASVQVDTIEVDLKNKPATLLEISPKGTVPVLQLAYGDVLEESRDIMAWAFEHAADRLIRQAYLQTPPMQALVDENDNYFKYWLDRYKYADRFPEFSMSDYRDKASIFLQQLNSRLEGSQYLFGDQATYADIAIIPFIRQFAGVDRQWFAASEYAALINWWQTWLESELVQEIMKKNKV